MQRAFALLAPFAGCAAMSVLCAWLMRRKPPRPEASTAAHPPRLDQVLPTAEPPTSTSS